MTEHHIKSEDAVQYTINMPKLGLWQCRMFGGSRYNMVFVPALGEEPNWFHRWMQHICFGHVWIKIAG